MQVVPESHFVPRSFRQLGAVFAILKCSILEANKPISFCIWVVLSSDDQRLARTFSLDFSAVTLWLWQFNVSATTFQSPSDSMPLATRLTLTSFESHQRKSNFESLLAMALCPGSDWNSHQKSKFVGLLAMSRCPGSDQIVLPKSNFEGLLAMSRCPGSDWKPLQQSQPFPKT